MADVFPHMSELDLTITEEITESVDVVFSALPHAASAERIGRALAEGVKAVDISADFRLKDLDMSMKTGTVCSIHARSTWKAPFTG